MAAPVRDVAGAERARVRALVGTVRDPELPVLTLEDLGVLRDVVVEEGRVVVTLTPTYTGCPALATMRDDVVHVLHDHGHDDVEVRVSLDPPWSSAWISERGRAALVAHGISAPGPVRHHDGPVPLTLVPRPRALTCPRCGSGRTELTSEFGPTACTAVYRCVDCREPFEHVKEI